MIAQHPLFEAPRAAPWLASYWSGLERGELRLPRCSKCGRWEWYPIEAGPGCLGAEYQWERVGPLATVFTFTRVMRPLLPDVKESYVTGLVVADEAPNCRIPALFAESNGPITIGARVRLRFAGEGSSVFPYFIREDNP